MESRPHGTEMDEGKVLVGVQGEILLVSFSYLRARALLSPWRGGVPVGGVQTQDSKARAHLRGREDRFVEKNVGVNSFLRLHF